MFKLRQLKYKDIDLMLEWMHDESVTKFMQKNFMGYTRDDCALFVEKCLEDYKNCQPSNINFAIIDENDTYLGTVSLKNIKDNNAEFAIAIRSSAMGGGCANYAIKEIIRWAFKETNINLIYWYVRKDNVRAIKFYNNNGFTTVDIRSLNTELKIKNISKYNNCLWYSVKKFN